MDDQMKIILEKTIEELSRQLLEAEPGSQEYKNISEALSKMYDALNEANRIETDFILRDDAATKDHKLSENKETNTFWLGITSTTSMIVIKVLEWYVMTRLFHEGLNWESTGIVSSKINSSILGSIFRFRNK
ncbi:MAG: hypothetical protein J6O18_05085 [Bacilli bacterium]|nr:hypothetical protein [Bacilli bacterium]